MRLRGSEKNTSVSCPREPSGLSDLEVRIMSTTSNPTTDLIQRLHKTMAERLTQTENLIDQSLSSFEAKLRQRLNAAEHSMSDGLNRLIETGQITRYKLWLAPLIVGLSLSLGLLLGSAVSLRALTTMIVERVQTLDRHQQAIQTMRAAGIETHPSNNGLYLITPHNISKPVVYTLEQYPSRWIIKIPEN